MTTVCEVELAEMKLERLAEFLGLPTAQLADDLELSEIPLIEFANLRCWRSSPSKVIRILKGEPEPADADDHERSFLECLAEI
jgi:hypothetical protein